MAGKAIGKMRWLISVPIVVAVLAASALLILKFREAPGTLPFQAIGDGSGGVFVAWQESQGVRVQHIDASGQPLWVKGGIPVQKIATQVNPRVYPGLTLFMLTADGTGGAILTWQDRLTFPGPLEGPPVKLYSQRLSADGELLWNDGVVTGMVEPISSGTGWVVPDGTGGAIFGWNDYKTYFRALHDDFLRLQKVSPDGRLLWGPEGVLVTASSPYRPMTEQDRALGIQGTITRSWPTYDGHQVVVSDGAGGAIAIWHEEDYPNRMHRIHARRLDANGSFAWPEPVLLRASSNSFSDFSPLASAADESDGTVTLVVQGGQGVGDPHPSTTLVRFDRDGHVVSQQTLPSSAYVVSDGRGGVILWRYEQTPFVGPPSERSVSLHVQRLDRDGSELWTDRPVIAAEKGEYLDVDSVGDGSGGAIVVWRFGQGEDNAYGKIFALGLDAAGNTAWGEGGVALFTDSRLKYQGRPTAIRTASGTIVIAAVGRGAMRGDMIYAQKVGDGGRLLWGSGIRIDR